MCYRSYPMRYQNHLSLWSSVIGFGTIRSDFVGMEEGVIFGIWETGPWLGIKYRTSQSYPWVALGDNFLLDLQLWRHTCFMIDFDQDLIQLVENGKVSFKTQLDQVDNLGRTMNHVAAGCFYRQSGSSGYQSMYERVTDVQIFGTILSDHQMEDITGCKSRGRGDILSWDSARWVMGGTLQNIKNESLDWGTSICKSLNISFHIIPQKLSFKS